MVKASIKTIEKMVNESDANHGIKNSIIVKLSKVERELGKGSDEKAYQELEKVRDHISKMNSNIFNQTDKEEILKLVDYILEKEML